MLIHSKCVTFWDCLCHSFIHSFIYYAFIKSTQGLAPSRYRTCHRIIQKYNTNMNHTVLAKRLGYIYHLLQDATEIWLYPFNQNKDKGFNPNWSQTWLDNMLPQSTSVAHSTWVTVRGLLRTSTHRATRLT